MTLHTMVWTRIPDAVYSFTAVLMRLITPALLAAYTEAPGLAPIPLMEAMSTIATTPCSSMCGISYKATTPSD